MIHINNLSVGSRLLPLSFEVNQGEVVHVIGPNGSGKSTLLTAIAGLLTAKGEVRIGELDVAKASMPSLASCRAFLSQSDRPAFNIEVVQYLALSLPSQAKSMLDEVNAAVHTLAQWLQLEDKLHRSIHQLSGGEWQRVRLCGICLQVWPTLNPLAKVLILDEPAAPLDIGQETLLYRLIDKIAQLGITVVMSNHDLNRTLTHAHKVALLDRGVLQQFGLPEEVLNEAQLSRVFNTEVRCESIRGKRVLLF